MSVIRCQVVINPSAAPRDQIINTWWCARDGETDPDAAAAAFKSALSTFYAAVDGNFGGAMNGEVSTFTAWDLSEPKPRQPIYGPVTVNTVSTSHTNTLPRELCVCLSFHGSFVSGEPPARRRGRVFLGPLASGGIASGNSGKLHNDVVSSVVAAASDLLTTSDASGAFSWVVYSPTTDGNDDGSSGVYNVIGGWVDNEFDIQRRRGQVSPTTRSLFS